MKNQYLAEEITQDLLLPKIKMIPNLLQVEEMMRHYQELALDGLPDKIAYQLIKKINKLVEAHLL